MGGFEGIPPGQSHPHHAFAIPQEDVLWWMEHLQYWGVNFVVRARRAHGSVGIYFKDPDGHELELICSHCGDEVFDQLPPVPTQEAGSPHLTPKNDSWPPPERAEGASRHFEAKLAEVRARQRTH